MNYDYENPPKEKAEADKPVFPSHSIDPRDYLREARRSWRESVENEERPDPERSERGGTRFAESAPLTESQGSATQPRTGQRFSEPESSADSQRSESPLPEARGEAAQPAALRTETEFVSRQCEPSDSARPAPWWESQKSPEPVYSEPNYREVTQAEPRSTFYIPSYRSGDGFDEKLPSVRKERDRPRRGGFARALCLALVCAIIGAAGGVFGTWYAIGHGGLKVPGSTTVVLGSAADNSGIQPTASPVTGIDTGKLTAPDIYNVACEQVVSVMSEITQRGFFGYQTGIVYGSGFIISEDGYILTNHHVIADAISSGADINIVVKSGETYKATVVGYEEDNDVAVVKIEAKEKLKPVKIGSSADMKVGEAVFAIGNPRRLDYTMTEGIVSALDREVAVEDDYVMGSYMNINMFQISAAVNSGNSGGPVFNDRGEVIGIVSAKYMSEGAEGLGFAIPIDDAIAIAAELIQYGYVSGKASIGIEGAPVDEANARVYHMVVGVYVSTVFENSAAAHAGIQVGDIITGLGGEEVRDLDTLKSIKKNFKAGDTTDITVWRSGEYLELRITFDEEVAVNAG